MAILHKTRSRSHEDVAVPSGAKREQGTGASSELQARRALGNIAKSDFTISFSLVQERRNERYELRNRARDLARSVPAQRAQKIAVDKYEHILQAEKHRAERKGRLFDLSSVKEKAPSFRSHRMAYCGSSITDTRLPVVFRENFDSAGITNLQSCGSYACPVCAPKVGQRRFEEVTEVLKTARENGYAVSMVTLTMRHKSFHKLSDLWDALSCGWRAFTTSKEWTGESEDYYNEAKISFELRGNASDGYKRRKAKYKEFFPDKEFPENMKRAPRGWSKSKTFRDRLIGLKEELGVIGTIRSTEVTVGKNGWHPHVHALVIHEAGKNEAESLIRAQKIGSFIHDRWSKGLESFGFESLAESGGLDVSVMSSSDEDIAGYATKIARTSGLDKATEKMGFESTRGDLKKGRFGSLTPLELLANAVEGEADSIAMWQEFATTSQGRRWVVISPDLRKLAKLGQEKTDEEIAEETVEAFEVAEVDYLIWKQNKLWLCASELLAILESKGPLALFEKFDSLGVPYRDVRADSIQDIEKPRLQE